MLDKLPPTPRPTSSTTLQPAAGAPTSELAPRAGMDLPESPRVEPQAHLDERAAFERRKQQVMSQAHAVLGQPAAVDHNDESDAGDLQQRIDAAIERAGELLEQPDAGKRKELVQYPEGMLHLVTEYMPGSELPGLERALPAFGPVMRKHPLTKEVLDAQTELEEERRAIRAGEVDQYRTWPDTPVDQLSEKLLLAERRRLGHEPADKHQATAARNLFDEGFSDLVMALAYPDSSAGSEPIEKMLEPLNECLTILASRGESPTAQGHHWALPEHKLAAVRAGLEKIAEAHPDTHLARACLESGFFS